MRTAWMRHINTPNSRVLPHWINIMNSCDRSDFYPFQQQPHTSNSFYIIMAIFITEKKNILPLPKWNNVDKLILYATTTRTMRLPQTHPSNGIKYTFCLGFVLFFFFLFHFSDTFLMIYPSRDVLLTACLYAPLDYRIWFASIEFISDIGKRNGPRKWCVMGSGLFAEAIRREYTSTMKTIQIRY